MLDFNLKENAIVYFIDEVDHNLFEAVICKYVKVNQPWGMAWDPLEKYTFADENTAHDWMKHNRPAIPFCPMDGGC